MNKRKQSDSAPVEEEEEEKEFDTASHKQYKMSSSDSNAEMVALDAAPGDAAALNANKKIPPKLTEWLQTFYNWSHNERITALDSLVTSEICEVQQMRHLLSLIEPLLQRDFISLLPKELSLYVLSFLEPSDLLSAAQTCRYWRILCEDNLLWREKCREEGLEDHECFSDFLRNRLSTAAVSNISNPSSIASEESSSSQALLLARQSSLNQDNFYLSDYKLAYLRHKSIEFNWRFGELNYNSELDQPQIVNNSNHNNQADNQLAADNNNIQSTSSKACQAVSLPKNSKPRRLKEILHLKGHEDHVITCLQFNPSSNIIVSGSDDNTLKVWSSITGRCLRTLNGHTGGVWSSQLSSDNVVISGSTDRTLRVWNALNGQCLHVLYGHTSTVRCMALHGKYVVSGSRDATLRVWNIENGGCDHVLVGHLAAVRCVQFNGTLCVSGAYDFLVKVWDVASETCLHTLEGHTNRVYSLQFDGIHIVSGSLDTSIRVWSADTGRLKHTLIGHQSLTSGMQLRGNILVSGNADSTVKVWDINTGQCLQTLSGSNKHQSAVTCLQFNSNFVITSSDDGTVKLWDLKTGDFIRNLVSLPSGGSGGVVWRIRASTTKLVCAVGSRNGTEETKLLVLDFETPNTSFDYEMRSLSCEFFANSPSQSVLPPFFNSCDSPSAADQLNNSQCANSFPVVMEEEHVQSEAAPSSNESTNHSESSSGPSSASSSAMSSLSSTPSSSHIFSISPSLQQSFSSSNSSSISCTGKKSTDVSTTTLQAKENRPQEEASEESEEEKEKGDDNDTITEMATTTRKATDPQPMEQES